MLLLPGERGLSHCNAAMNHGAAKENFTAENAEFAEEIFLSEPLRSPSESAAICENCGSF